jgi:hypothetical protein
MASKKKVSLTEKQRADLNALAQKAENAYGDFRQAIEAIGPDEEWDGSCLACPKRPGGGVCSSFLGHASSPDARCQRDFCGHSHRSHVGGAGVQ